MPIELDPCRSEVPRDAWELCRIGQSERVFALQAVSRRIPCVLHAGPLCRSKAIEIGRYDQGPVY